MRITLGGRKEEARKPSKAIRDGDFKVAHASVEVDEQRGGLIGDDGGFEVGAGEVADGFEGTPGGFDDDFDFAFEAAKGNGGSDVARDVAKLGHNVFGKVLEILGQLRFGGAG
jgi:hypothetical protein